MKTYCIALIKYDIMYFRNLLYRGKFFGLWLLCLVLVKLLRIGEIFEHEIKISPKNKDLSKSKYNNISLKMV